MKRINLVKISTVLTMTLAIILPSIWSIALFGSMIMYKIPPGVE
jgi:hypothetical protein